MFFVLTQSLKKQLEAKDNLEEANNRTIQELLEKQKQLQATIDEQTNTVEALNQTVKMLRGYTHYVSTSKFEGVKISKLTKIIPAINPLAPEFSFKF
jgi:predicted RNase H-like nuclease (RuvC/YqgF family)